MAELERATISERMTMGRDRVARDGCYTGGPVPLGLTLTADNRFAPSDRIMGGLGVSEAEYVQRLFARVANGDTTLKAERQRLPGLGLPHRLR